MKKQQNNDILDDKIEVLGKDWNKIHKRNKILLIICTIVAILALLYIIIFVIPKNKPDTFTQEEIEEIGTEENVIFNISPTNKQAESIVSILDTTITIIQELDSEKLALSMRIYTPHNAQIELIVGSDNIDSNDQTLVLVAQAADIRGDNQDILGDFVFKGEQLANGHSKMGYCAIFDNHIHIGQATTTAYLDSAITKKGYFFRQYPLVINGIQIQHKPKNTNIRRALCIWNEKLVVIESQEHITLDNFSQALTNIGVTSAINLVGGSEAQGWAITADQKQIPIATKQRNYQANRTFITFKNEH